jgi:ribose-phosphate pyrophosphokinase
MIINVEEQNVIWFPGGEPHVKLAENVVRELEIYKSATLYARISNFNDLGALLAVTDAVRRIVGQYGIDLIIPYFPGARQDRVSNPGEALTVKMYADVINLQGYGAVSIIDPHSDVTPALINDVKVYNNHSFIEACRSDSIQWDYLISPDQGATKKIYPLATELQLPVVECSKKRDTKTGKLSGFAVNYGDLEGKTCVVVDDICDGGATFLGLADELKKHNAGKLILCVTHGIFSKGTEKLFEKYDEIHSTDSFRSLSNSGVNIHEVF